MVVHLANVAELGPAVSLRVAHEADVLHDFPGPDGRPQVIDHGSEAGVIWLVLPAWRGPTLADRLATGSLSVDDTLTVATGLVSQLVVAHRHGVIHRDICPGVIAVEASDPISATLTAFGLLRAPDPFGEEQVEAARYCSPEQAGLISPAVDERSDLYSFGLVIYGCLAGRPLFDGPTVSHILRQQLLPRPTLAARDESVPRSLAAVIGRLLQIDPSRRYQEAEAVLADLEEIVAKRAAGVFDPPLVVGRHDRRSSLADPGFVGRQSELSALEAELGAARRGRGGLVTVEGESGAGKSRLLDEIAQRATAAGMLVLRGQGADRTASRPFQIFEQVTTDLATAAGSDPALAERITQGLSSRSEAVAVAAPSLAALVGSPEARGEAAMPEEHGWARVVDALAAILDATGSESRPALVVLDDCQWAQTLTAGVVGSWSAGARPRWVMVVAAFRSDEVPLTSPLRTVETSRNLLISGLTDTHIRELVESMAGGLPEAAVAAVTRLAGGNAFMASALIRGMIETGALIPSEQGWTMDEAAAAEIQTSRQAALLLVERLEALEPAARTLLAAAAVIGKTADVDLVVALSRLTTIEAVPAIDEVRKRRILWMDDGAGKLHFSHDILRETVLQRLSDEDRHDLHLRAATYLLDAADEYPYRIAYHLDMAGRSEDAFPYAVRAAEAARNRHALEDAETYYLVARKGATDDQARFLVADGLGEVTSLAGRYGEAELYLTEAAGLARDPLDQAAELGKLGEVAFRRGDQVSAGDRLETAVRRLGGRIPRRRLALVALLMWEMLVQFAHTVTRNRFTRRRQPDKRDQLRLRFYSRLAYVYWFRNGRLRCLWVHLREMNLAERFGPSLALAQAYSEHAPVMTTIPWFGRGIAYARKSLALREEMGDIWGQGQSLNFYGVSLYAASRYDEAVKAFEEANRKLAPTADRWEMHTALWNLALARYRKGDWHQAAAIAADVYESAERMGDQSSAAIALSIWSRAAVGSAPDDSAVDLAASRIRDDHHAAAEIALARAVRQLNRGQAREASATLEAAWADIRRAGMRQEYVAPVLPWWATALRMQLDGMPAEDPERRALARRARWTARRALLLSRSYRNNLPHARRELALLDIRNGRIRRGRRGLERSVRVAAEQGATWEEANSRRELARLSAALGRPGAAEALREAEMEMGAIEERPGRSADEAHPGSTLSLADRFSTLLNSGRQIASSSTRTAVFSSVEASVADLLRSETCEVVEVDADGRPLDPATSADPGVSKAVLLEAVTSRAVVTRTAPADAGQLGGARSVLCAPIVCDDRVVACLYATHGEVSALFGPEEERLATYIATLAGATLEHVIGSRAYFRALIENAHDITIITDEDGRILYVSPAVGIVLGRRPADVEGGSYLDLAHADDLHQLHAVWSKARDDPGRPQRGEIRFKHADGTWRWISLIVSSRTDDPAVQGVVFNLRDITERRRAEEDLIYQALHDPLTGLPNRRLLLDRLEQSLTRARRSGAYVAVLFLDLDRFKAINDSLGHTAGDQVLVESASRLRELTRSSDTLARLGGDEFLVVVDDLAEPDEAAAVAVRIEDALRRPIIVEPGGSVSVTTSIGVTVAKPGDDPSSLLRNADTALYAAKQQGRGCYRVFGQHLQASTLRGRDSNPQPSG